MRDVERAVALIPAEPPSAEHARALGQLGLFLMLAGQPARSLEHSTQAVAIARKVGARTEEADALVSVGQDLVTLGDRPAGLEALRRARSISVEIGDDELLSHVAVAFSDGLRRDGRLEQAVEVALDGAAVSRRAGLDMRERMCALNAAEAAHELGRWDLVEQLSSDVLASDQTGVTLAFAHRMAGVVARTRGDLEGAAAHLAAQREAVGSDAGPEHYDLEDEAELALWQGRPEVAARAAHRGCSRRG